MKRKFIVHTFICKMCRKIADRKSENQRFCGSLRKKEGCSYRNDREYQKKYRIKHREHCKALLKQWKKDHPNYDNEWCKNNRDKVNVWQRKWREKNPGYFKKWRKKNDKT